MSFLAPTSTASPTPSNASSTGNKRKRPAAPPVTASATSLSESAAHLRSQVHFAVQRLKTTDKPVSFQDLVGYLSIQDGQLKGRLKTVLNSHDQIEYTPSGFGGKGAYRYRPKYNVRSADELKGVLQKQKNSLGINAKELRDGWPGAWDAINELEKKGDVLVVRNKKEQTPKTIWHNDPSLSQNIEPIFTEAWHRIVLPANPDELRAKLEAAGLKPTSAPKEGMLAPKQKDKKKKTIRKSGRQTNTHMAGILRDYSHKRK